MSDHSDASEADARTLGGCRLDIVDTVGPAWDAIVAGFADACLEQTSAYMAARWSAGRLMGLVLREAATNEPVAVALAVIAMLPMLRLGLAYVKFGPLWRRKGRPADASVLAAALGAVKAVFAAERGLVARIMPPPDPGFETAWSEALRISGYTLHAPAPDSERYLVDLTLSEKDQLASLGASWRANLNKARRNDLDISEVGLREGLPEFLALYRDMVVRKQFADRHGVDALPTFAAAAPAALGARLFLARDREGPVAGSLVAGAGERVFVPFSASNARALPLRAGYALRWAIIEQLRGSSMAGDSSARWLDLGGAEGDAGLRSFKQGNVGKRGRVVPLMGEYDHAGSALSSAVAAAMTFTRRLSHTGPAQKLFARA
jgi:GNAT acetyltransferase-like protein